MGLDLIKRENPQLHLVPPSLGKDLGELGFVYWCTRISPLRIKYKIQTASYLGSCKVNSAGFLIVGTPESPLQSRNRLSLASRRCAIVLFCVSLSSSDNES